eukprot:TRINITY_DN3100_c0_g1_i1.p1 TRINITY_DN3100_c0_g1~~TRINITY_DN3100_c0_g1_i1.p1  ORF type:complete len:490 (+),score=109.31 TRINITY_DN3100_c0_g1_i1:39-1508(+)
MMAQYAGYMPTSPVHSYHSHPTQAGAPVSPRHGYYGQGGGMAGMATQNGFESQLAKIVTIVSGETGEEQNFRLCAGESGENVRAAITGAFGLPPSETFSIRDATGCNIIIGFPSVVDSGRYELVKRSTTAGFPHVPQAQSIAQPVAHSPIIHQPLPPMPVMPSSPHTSYQQAVQPTISHSLQQVHHIQQDLPLPATLPFTPLKTYQEVVTTRPPSKEFTVGTRNKKHHQGAPMGGAFKTLCIGINYTGQKEALSSPVSDVQAMRGYLGEAGFHGQQLVLTDESQTDPAHIPTKENIMRGLRWLCQGAKAGDALVLHFAGHGVEVRDEKDDDKYDEAVLPVDFRSTRPFQVLKSEEITHILTTSLPHGCKLLIVADCAHSGGLVSLPYSLTARKDGNLEWKEKAGCPEPAPEIIQISGCRNDQTTDSAVNALTPAFIQAMARDTNPSCEALIIEIRNNLYQRSGVGYQVPQISSSKRFAFTDRFYLSIDP